MSAEARILIVDDDEALLEALPEAVALRMSGIAVDTAATAKAALAQARATDYDAIVSDIKMPGMDGLELLTEIKKLRPTTPTLLITGHGERELAVQALRGGAYDFVQKPIDRDYFVASLERAIETRRLARRVEEQQRALERHARVLEHVDEGVFVVDGAGLVQHWNPAAEAITGLPAATVLGRRAGDVLPGWEAVGDTVPVADAPGPGSLRAKTVPLELAGREIWLSISGVRFDDGVVYAFRNLTEERALDELTHEFVATVSHELRTPLAAIYGSAQTLRRRDVELAPADRERLLDVISRESERLTRIAEEILLANTIDSGRLVVEREQVDLDALVREAVDEMRAGFGERDDISFDVTVGDGVEPVCADGGKLRQVLLNLLENAVKYSPDGGRVAVSVERAENGARIAVTDEGLGIPASEQRRIFGKFYRLDPDLRRGVGGTGLGLYISAELVRHLGGRLSVISQEGAGSTFVVELPVTKASPEAAPARPVAQTA